MTDLNITLLKQQLEDMSVPKLDLKYAEYCELDPIRNELVMFYTYTADPDENNNKTNSVGFAIIKKALYKSHEQILIETFTKVEKQIR